MDEIRKNIDETWKDTVEKDKDKLKKEGSLIPPEADFKFFVTTLALQASISLGVLPNPANNQKEKNVSQAKFIIDTLGMIKEKTQNNLNKEEAELLEGVLYELRMHYISENQGGTK